MRTEIFNNSNLLNNYYLNGKANYDLGNRIDKVSKQNLPPISFNFCETIQEIGFDFISKNIQFEYQKEQEVLISIEPFQFKDFDSYSGSQNIWDLYELLFHQQYFYGVSFKTKNTTIYNQLINYLRTIYGEYRIIPDQQYTTDSVAWFVNEFKTTIYLEIEQINKEKVLVLTFYDELIRMNLKYNTGIYNLIKNECYEKDRIELKSKIKKGFFSLFYKKQLSKETSDFEFLKTKYHELLSNDNSDDGLSKIASYLFENIDVRILNLEIGEWLIKIAIKIQDKKLFIASELIYKIIINWYKAPGFIASKDRIKLVANAYKNLINVYGDNKRPTEAIEAFNNCLALLTDSGSLMNNANHAFIAGQANYNVARVYHSISKNKIALKHSKNAIDFFTPSVSPWMDEFAIMNNLLCLNNIGLYSSEVGNYDEAILYYEKAINFSLEYEKFYMSSIMKMNLANTYVKDKKYDLALVLFESIIESIINEPFIYRDTPLYSQVLINMADLFLETKELEKEKKYIEKAINYYESMKSFHPEVKDSIKELKSRINQK